MNFCLLLRCTEMVYKNRTQEKQCLLNCNKICRVRRSDSTHLRTTFYPAAKMIRQMMSFGTDVHRDVVVMHKKYDLRASYAKSKKPKKSFFFYFGGDSTHFFDVNQCIIILNIENV